MFGDGYKKKLKSESEYDRSSAARDLYYKPRRSAVPALLEALADNHPNVRSDVMRALDACDPHWRTSGHGQRAFQQYNARVLADGDFLAVRALVLFDDPRACQALWVSLQKHPANEDAIRGLVQMRDPRAFDAIAAGLRVGAREKYSSWYSRIAVYFQDLGDARAVPVLIEVLPALGREVIAALEHFCDPRSAQALVSKYESLYADPSDYSGNGEDMVAIVSALRKILGRGAGAVSAQTLKAITALKDRSYSWTIQEPSCAFQGSYGSARADCTLIRQQARQELLRRGVQ